MMLRQTLPLARLLFTVIGALFIHLSIQPELTAQQIIWEQRYVTPRTPATFRRWFQGEHILPMPDGGFLLTGYCGEHSGLVRTDAEGEPIWSLPIFDSTHNLLGDVGFDDIESIKSHFSFLDEEGRIVFIGNQERSWSGFFYRLLVDPERGVPLDTISGRYDSTTSIGSYNPLLRLHDGHFLEARPIPYAASDHGGAYMLSPIRPSGRYGGWRAMHAVDTVLEEQLAHHPRSMVQADDGSIVLWGTWGIAGGPPTHLFLTKLDTLGNKIWERRPGRGTDTLAFPFGGVSYLDRTADGGYVAVAGIARRDARTGARWQDAYVARFDADGRTIWERTVQDGRTLQPATVRQMADGGYVVAGYVGPGGWSYRDSSESFVAFKLSADGKEEWWREWGTPGLRDRLHFALPLDDGSLLVAGESDWDAYMAKLSVGTSAVPPSHVARSGPRVVPNPARDLVRVEGVEEIDAAVELLLYDAAGRLVAARYRFDPTGAVIIEAADLPAGIYRAVIMEEGGASVGTTIVVVR